MRPSFESRLTQGPATLSSVVIAGDPDGDARVVLAAALTSAGYRIRLADTGEALLREAMADDVNLALVDIDLLCSDGRSAVETFTSAHELREIPIVAFGGAPPSLAETRALASGADHFLRNPWELPMLFEVVASMRASAQKRPRRHAFDDVARPPVTSSPPLGGRATR